jgi:hypothetical protein
VCSSRQLLVEHCMPGRGLRDLLKPLEGIDPLIAQASRFK